MSDNLRIHPIWKEVALSIMTRVEIEGYGFMIEHAELCDMLEIKKPTTIEEAMKQRLEILNKTEELRKELLYQYNVQMYNEFNKGYRILAPSEQVTKGFEREFDKARKKIRKAIDVLTYVNHDLLSDDSKLQRDRNLNKSVFVLSAFNKRRIPDVGQKKIANGTKD